MLEYASASPPWIWPEPGMTARRDVDDSQQVALQDLGVFDFAKRTGQLLVPMGIIAGLFAVWLKAEIASVKADMVNAFVVHSRETRTEMVTRMEFDLLKQAVEERHRAYLMVEQEQGKQIHKNTLYLEAIGFKLGIKRNTE